MKELLECAAQHWVFSCVVMAWIYGTADIVTARVYNSILVLIKGAK
jgi:hypothetical protein